MKISIQLYAVLIFGTIFFTSCNRFFEALVYPRPEPDDFEYYDEHFKLPKYSGLNTESFYYTQGTGVSGEYYSYLRFYPDGAVLYYGGTALPPDSIKAYGFTDVQRRKHKGTPKARKTPWGYYKLSGDSLYLSLIDYGPISSKIKKFKGSIQNDSLIFKVYEKLTSDSEFSFSYEVVYRFTRE